jgi:hypothetical protein
MGSSVFVLLSSSTLRNHGQYGSLENQVTTKHASRGQVLVASNVRRLQRLKAILNYPPFVQT